jgi:outer membrane protein assembly factor BamA
LSVCKTTFSINKSGRKNKKITSSKISHNLTYDKTNTQKLPNSGFKLIGSQEYGLIDTKSNYGLQKINLETFKSYIYNNCATKFSAIIGHIITKNIYKIKIPSSASASKIPFNDYQLKYCKNNTSKSLYPKKKLDNNNKSILIEKNKKRTKHRSDSNKYYFLLSSELSLPLKTQKKLNITRLMFVHLGIEYDNNNLKFKYYYNKKNCYKNINIQGSIGIGILWQTNIMPIRMNYALPLQKYGRNKTQNISLKFSTSL